MNTTALSLADARKQVNEQRALLDKGIDPIAERERLARVAEPEPAAPVFTFADFVPMLYRVPEGARCRAGQDEESKINRHLLPAWGGHSRYAKSNGHRVHELLDTIAGKGFTKGVNRVQALI